MGTITTKNIHKRFRHAINTLSKSHEDLGDFRKEFTEEQWYEFVSFMSGWVVTSLLNSEEKENSKDRI